MKKTASPAIDGRNVASPYIMVPDIEAELNFIENVFGGDVIERVYHPDGHIIHGEVRIFDSVIMIGLLKKGFPATEPIIYVYSKNVQNTYLSALEHGAESFSKPGQTFYGIKEASVRDVQGIQWRIAEVIELLTEEEMEKNLREQSGKG